MFQELIILLKHHAVYKLMCVQWNPYNADTLWNGKTTALSVYNSYCTLIIASVAFLGYGQLQ